MELGMTDKLPVFFFCLLKKKKKKKKNHCTLICFLNWPGRRAAFCWLQLPAVFCPVCTACLCPGSRAVRRLSRTTWRCASNSPTNTHLLHRAIWKSKRKTWETIWRNFSHSKTGWWLPWNLGCLLCWKQKTKKKLQHLLPPEKKKRLLAGMGIEPTTSALLARRSNQLS